MFVIMMYDGESFEAYTEDEYEFLSLASKQKAKGKAFPKPLNRTHRQDW